MRRGLILVEGQTEEVFVKRTLQPHLWNVGLHLQPTILATRRVQNGPDFRGGATSWGQIRRDLSLLARDSGVAVITTLIDYYALPSDVPGMSNRPTGSARSRVEHVESAISAEVADRRLRPHLVLHEFETLLYASPATCGDYLGNDALTAAMTAATHTCGEPELVNDSATTAPSKRILAAHPTYRKTSDGPTLLDLIGIDTVRSACPHFADWLTHLETL